MFEFSQHSHRRGNHLRRSSTCTPIKKKSSSFLLTKTQGSACVGSQPSVCSQSFRTLCHMAGACLVPYRLFSTLHAMTLREPLALKKGVNSLLGQSQGKRWNVTMSPIHVFKIVSSSHHFSPMSHVNVASTPRRLPMSSETARVLLS